MFLEQNLFIYRGLTVMNIVDFKNKNTLTKTVPNFQISYLPIDTICSPAIPPQVMKPSLISLRTPIPSDLLQADVLSCEGSASWSFESS